MYGMYQLDAILGDFEEWQQSVKAELIAMK